MKNEAIKIFQRKRKQILESWMKLQMADESLREDLISNEELRGQSEELLNALFDNLNDTNVDDVQHAEDHGETEREQRVKRAVDQPDQELPEEGLRGNAEELAHDIREQ